MWSTSGKIPWNWFKTKGAFIKGTSLWRNQCIFRHTPDPRNIGSTIIGAFDLIRSSPFLHLIWSDSLPFCIFQWTSGSCAPPLCYISMQWCTKIHYTALQQTLQCSKIYYTTLCVYCIQFWFTWCTPLIHQTFHCIMYDIHTLLVLLSVLYRICLEPDTE